MPRYSDNTLLQRAINRAVLDRESLADAYGGRGDQAAKAMASAAKSQALRGKKISALTPEEQDAAFRTLVYAEQWEESLADSQPRGSKEQKEAQAWASRFREVRIRLWGRTTLEAATEKMTSYVLQPGFNWVPKDSGKS